MVQQPLTIGAKFRACACTCLASELRIAIRPVCSLTVPCYKKVVPKGWPVLVYTCIHSSMLWFIAERLSARLIILQRGRFVFVCMYVSMYIRHTLISVGSHTCLVDRTDTNASADGSCMSSLYATVLERESKSKGRLRHKKAGQRKENMIE